MKTESTPVFSADWKDRVLQLLFPRVCPVCGEILTEKSVAVENPYICRDCYACLQFVGEPYCMKCGKPLESEEEEFCRNCRETSRGFDRGAALLVHDDRARIILYGLKYSNQKDYADFLAREAARRLGQRLALWDPDVIVPVPLHKKRYFDRGFNQAELLAVKLSEELLREQGYNLPVNASLLKRSGKTIPQKELDDRQRRENVASKFSVVRKTQEGALPEAIPDRVLLLDDIFTSGATLEECANVLKGAGVKKVFFLTMSIVG